MAFIEKKDPVVLNIKLTSKGREQLSKGKLNFKYFAVGDSEIDYKFNRENDFNSFNSNILSALDKNPKQLSFIPRNFSDDVYNEIVEVPSTKTTIENQVQPIGFFNDDSTEFLIDTNHMKQPDIGINISGVTGGTIIKLKQAPTYQGNQNEPEIGDILMIKWTTPDGVSTTGYTINYDEPTPYLFYKINDIVSGSLSNDNLIVNVDRELPDYSNYLGGSNDVIAGAHLFYDNIIFSGDTQQMTENVDTALLTFLQNCQCPTITFPYWNLSIVYTKNIIGVNPETDKTVGSFNSKGFAGFVSYIQNQNPIYDKLGVIHYTNNSVSNTYGEGFYGDPLNSIDVDKLPTLDIPTIMWHKSSSKKLGVTLKPINELKYLTGGTKSLNTRYYDLADENNNVVGKVFYDLEIFLIEDQELLYAMSYKSNRSWTLPNYGIDINANVTFGCQECLMTYDVNTTSPTIIGGGDGEIIINNIQNNVGDPEQGQLILEILSGTTGTTTERIYFDTITGDTTITNEITLNNRNLVSGDYVVRLIDLGAPNCVVVGEITIEEPTSILSVYGEETTYSSLNSYFNVEAYNDTPTRIRITSNDNNSIGNPIGTAYATITPTGATNTELVNRFNAGEGTSDNDVLSRWVKVPNNDYVDVTNLTFREPYKIWVRDATGGTFNEINTSNAINSQIWSYYVAVTTPFNNSNDLNTTVGNDGNGQYVVVSNYLQDPLNAAKNPIVGEIEMSLHKSGENPKNWVTLNNYNVPPKLYLNGNSNDDWVVTVRETLDYINMYSVTTNIINDFN